MMRTEQVAAVGVGPEGVRQLSGPGGGRRYADVVGIRRQPLRTDGQHEHQYDNGRARSAQRFSAAIARRR